MILTLLSCLTTPPSEAAPPWKVAITIDDIPWNAGKPDEGVAPATKRILAALEKHQAPAVAFVNCEAAWPEVLALWEQGGVELGNHQSRHDDLKRVPMETWLEGAHACSAELRERGELRYFRYPYLRRGNDVETRDAVRRDLESSGLTIAPVTIDNHEWMLASEYAKSNENAAALYPGHLVAASMHFRDEAFKSQGRDVKHVLLLHANTLNADHLDAALTALENSGAVFITLEEALSDPVYALDDQYAGKAGVSWLDRVSGQPVTMAWETAEWKRLEAALGEEPPEESAK
ncbi:MAG: polysaccharide deacetylase family protein [Proteobacteria bacterium]|nr:polysaccharide deacetylase family protein [Pseudomonadota bacterium]